MSIHRWNFEATDTDVLVCRENHEKGEKCEYERMTSLEIVEILNKLRARVIYLENLASLMVMDK